MQSSSTFIKISGSVRAKRGVGKQVTFVPKTVWVPSRRHNSRKILLFFSSFKLAQNCYKSMNISFS